MGIKKVTLLITGLHRTIDNGEFLLLIGLVDGLRKEVTSRSSNLRLILYIICDNGYKDISRIQRVISNDKTCSIYPIKVVCPKRLRWFLPILRIMLYIILILKSDLVIHLGTDGFSDEAVGGPLSTLYHGLQLLTAHFLKRPVLLVSSSVGPFKTPYTRYYATFVLRRLDGITVRKGSSEKWLKILGLTDQQYISVADLAFLSGHNFNCNRKELLASVVVNAHIARQFSKYVDAMVFIADRLCERGFNVIIIPQIIADKYNEISIAREVWNRSMYKEKIKVLEESLPSDVEEIFHYSKIVVSSKHHSSILSFLTLTPTLTINYSPKVVDLHEMLSINDCVVNLMSNYSEFVAHLSEKIEFIINQYNDVRIRIAQKIPTIKELAKKNIEYIFRKFQELQII